MRRYMTQAESYKLPADGGKATPAFCHEKLTLLTADHRQHSDQSRTAPPFKINE